MPQPDPQPFGKYLLLDRIAAGGMAEIYRAKTNAVAGVSKQVVIKKILPHYAGNKSFVGMFINEAKIAAGLSHGNIAQIFDFGEVEGEYFLAMEFVHGQTLSRVMRRARAKGLPTLPTAFALYIVLELCKGLHYAHTRLDEQARPLNIIHRDVSPQNVLISYEGEIKIVDFGIAKARVAGQTETEAGAVKGKYTYFAPEQARGKDLDARTDVFAAGIVLYEMVCGKLPFEGKMVDVLTRIVRGEFERPRAVNPDVPPALERIVLTAMATDRTVRYPSAQSFQEAVATYLYANAPAFSASTLSQLMTFLFEQELAAEGRPTNLPRDFAEQLVNYRKPMTREPELPPLDQNTAAARMSARGRKLDEDTDKEAPSGGETQAISDTRSAADTDRPSADTSREDGRPLRTAINSSLGRLPPRWVYVSAPLLAMTLAAAVVLLVGHFSTYAIQLTSTPVGARVKVDGRPSPMSTPLLISDLSADRPHVLELSAPDRRPWRQEVPPSRGRTVPIHAQLEQAEQPRREQLPPLPPPEPPAPTDVKGPGTYVLSAQQHAFAVSATASARVRLDPRKSYRVWTEGRLALSAGAAGLSEAVAFLDAEPPLGAGETALLLGKRPVAVKGASWLFAFIPDDSPGDNSGGLKLRVQEKGKEKETLTLLLDAKQNAVALPREKRLRITDLDPDARYELTFKEGATAPRLSPSGRPVRVLVSEAGANPRREPVSGMKILTPSSRMEVTGASALTLAIPDDVVEGNAGTLEVSLVLAPRGQVSPTRIGP